MLYPEDEAYLLVKQAVSMKGALQSAAIAAARLRRAGRLGMQGVSLLHLTPQVTLGSPGVRPSLPQAGGASAYAPVGIQPEKY